MSPAGSNRGTSFSRSARKRSASLACARSAPSRIHHHAAGEGEISPVDFAFEVIPENARPGEVVAQGLKCAARFFEFGEQAEFAWVKDANAVKAAFFE